VTVTLRHLASGARFSVGQKVATHHYQSCLRSLWCHSGGVPWWTADLPCWALWSFPFHQFNLSLFRGRHRDAPHAQYNRRFRYTFHTVHLQYRYIQIFLWCCNTFAVIFGIYSQNARYIFVMFAIHSSKLHFLWHSQFHPLFSRFIRNTLCLRNLFCSCMYTFAEMLSLYCQFRCRWQ